MSGTITDRETNQPVYGAAVFIPGSTIGTVSDDRGHYRISAVPPGTYEIRFSSLGYAPVTIRDVRMSEDDSTILDASLVEQSIEVGEVVIAGKRIDDVSSMPQGMRNLEYKEIHSTAGAFDDVVRTVSLLPGVSAMRPDRNDLIVQGGAPDENLFIIDDIEFSNINHFGIQGSSAGTVSFINFEFIDDYTFSGSGFGVKYGDKLSSVLDIHLRDGRSDRYREKVTLSATELGLNLEGPIAEKGSYLFSARRSYLDPVFKFYGFSYVPYYWDFLGKAAYQFDKYNQLEIIGTGAIDRMRAINDTPQHIHDNARTLFANIDFWNGGAVWSHGMENGTLKTAISTSYAHYDYHQNNDTGKTIFHNLSYESETSLKSDYVLNISPHFELSSGISATIVGLDSRVIATIIQTGWIDYPKSIAVDTTNRVLPNKGAAYLQGRWKLGSATITAGLRADHFSMIKNENVVAPRLAVSYQLTDLTKITASVGRYFQAPSYIWLMTNPYNQSLNYLGADQQRLGISHFLSDAWMIEVDAYRKVYFNYPASTLRHYLVMSNAYAGYADYSEAYPSFGLDFLSSQGKGLSRGIELYLEKKISEIPLYGRLSITYSKTEFTALDSISRPGSNDRRWLIAAGAGYILNEQWEFTSSFRFASGRPYTPFNNGTFYRLMAWYNTARSQNNSNLDIRISRHWKMISWDLTTYIDVQNVYNKKWVDLPYWNSQNKREEVSPSLGIVPSLGVIAEF